MLGYPPNTTFVVEQTKRKGLLLVQPQGRSFEHFPQVNLVALILFKGGVLVRVQVHANEHRWTQMSTLYSSYFCEGMHFFVCTHFITLTYVFGQLWGTIEGDESMQNLYK